MSGPFGSTTWMANPAGFYPFEISNSLRLESASETLLEKTNAGSGGSAATIATLSCWFKYDVSDIESSQMPLIWNGSDASGISFAQSSNTPHQLYVYWGGQGALATTMKFRDPSAWYHVVAEIDSTQGTEANRLKLYINGVSTAYSGSFNQNTTSAFFNNNVKQRIGEDANNRHFGGYVTDINAIEGTAYDASYFGEFKNDIWVPKDPSVTYGTNGFRLQFKSSAVGTASASTIGADTSGNTNHFTSTNIAVHDQVPDSPTNNFATLNSVMRANITLTEGNLKALGVGNNYDNIAGTIPFDPTDSRGYYWEWYVVAHDDDTEIGIAKTNNVNFNQSDATNPTAHSSDTPSYRGSGQKKVANSNSNYGTAWDNGNILSVAVKSGSVFFYHNGTLQASGTAATTSLTGTWVPSFSINGTQSGIVNFGQDSSFAGNVTAQGNKDANGEGDFYYAPPAGYVALCTANLPDPAVATIDPNKGGSPQDYFNTIIWSGASDTAARDFSGVGFQPDWIWAKVRSAAGNHTIFDSVRGAGGDKELDSSDTGIEGAADTAQYGFIDEFLADGFSSAAGSSSGNNNLYFNDASETFVAWCWKAGTAFSNDASATGVGSIDSSGSVNTDVGFSIIKADSVPANTTSTIAHGLGVKPDMILLKSRNNSTNWEMYHSFLTPDAERKLYLNTNGAEIDTGFMNDTPPTSTVFSFNPGGSDSNHIAYCFTEVDGFSKFGTHIGNENDDGVFVYTGFRPAWILIKKVAAGDWGIYDSKRDGYNDSNAVLYPSENIAEENQSSRRIDLLSNGFKLRTSNVTFNDDSTSIFMAFAEQPFKYANAR